MSITTDSPLPALASAPLKTRAAVLAIFAAFTALFLAYVDLFLLLDDSAFKAVPDSFWLTYRFTFIAFSGIIIAVLLTALCLIVALSRSTSSPIFHKRTVFPVAIIAAIVSIGAWILFFTVHGFAISVLAVLSTFAIVVLVAAAACRNKTADVPYQYATLPVLLAVIAMLAMLVLVANSYLTLNSVTPVLFNAHIIELMIVLTVMGIAALAATIFGVRAMLAVLYRE